MTTMTDSAIFTSNTGYWRRLTRLASEHNLYCRRIGMLRYALLRDPDDLTSVVAYRDARSQRDDYHCIERLYLDIDYIAAGHIPPQDHRPQDRDLVPQGTWAEPAYTCNTPLWADVSAHAAAHDWHLRRVVVNANTHRYLVVRSVASGHYSPGGRNVVICEAITDAGDERGALGRLHVLLSAAQPGDYAAPTEPYTDPVLGITCTCDHEDGTLAPHAPTCALRIARAAVSAQRATDAAEREIARAVALERRQALCPHGDWAWLSHEERECGLCGAVELICDYD